MAMGYVLANMFMAHKGLSFYSGSLVISTNDYSDETLVEYLDLI